MNAKRTFTTNWSAAGFGDGTLCFSSTSNPPVLLIAIACIVSGKFDILAFGFGVLYTEAEVFK